MNRLKFGTSFGMTVLFAFIVFCSLSVSFWATYGVLYLLVANGIVDLSMAVIPHVGQLFTALAAISLPVGVVVAIGASQIPLRPIRNLIESMDRLASGEFGTRVTVGRIMKNYPAFVQLCDSFNRMARELENTELLRSDFINNFSHEFKTPIVSIAGFARLLRRGDLTEAEREEYLSIIEEESRRLSHIATNALNLSKLEKVAILTDVASFNLSEQLRSCVLLLESRWSQKNLDWDMDFEEFRAVGNEEMLKQVWINLMENAVKFSPEGGVIAVDVAREGETLSVRITNTGPRIPPASLDRIFQKFYQVDESHSGEGNGIGLAIVKRVVELHRGTVWVESTDKQTTFTVTLPMT